MNRTSDIPLTEDQVEPANPAANDTSNALFKGSPGRGPPNCGGHGDLGTRSISIQEHLVEAEQLCKGHTSRGGSKVRYIVEIYEQNIIIQYLAEEDPKRKKLRIVC